MREDEIGILLRVLDAGGPISQLRVSVTVFRSRSILGRFIPIGLMVPRGSVVSPQITSVNADRRQLAGYPGIASATAARDNKGQAESH